MRLTIKLQLAAAFGFIIVLLLVGNLFGLNSLSKSSAEMDAIIKGPTARLEAAQQLEILLLNMVRNEGLWQVRWGATALHPGLGANQTLALRADPPRRASVNERGGSDVLVPGYLYHYALDARAAGADLMPTARAVADAVAASPRPPPASPAAGEVGKSLAVAFSTKAPTSI